MQAGLHIVVRGVVQGVGFRYFVLRHAQTLNLAGWVRNLYNGNVEIEAEGDRSLLETFISELKVGPGAAHVTDLTLDWQPYAEKYKTFEIR